MQQSVYYKFNKPDYVDQYDLRHWNSNTDQLDTILYNNGLSPNNDGNALGNRIDAEVEARTNADTLLQDNIDNEASTREGADTQIRNDIGDGTLIAKKAEKDNDGNVIKNTYATKTALSEEATARANGDNLKVDKTVQIRISDSDGSHVGNAVSLNGSIITITLPSKIYGAVWN